MAERNQHIDDIFREGLGDYTEMPDASVWNNIEAGLDGKTSVPNDGGKSGGGAAGGAGISTGKILLILIAGAALFFTAKWAISKLSDKQEKGNNHIVITKEQTLPPGTLPDATDAAVQNEAGNNEIQNDNTETIIPATTKTHTNKETPNTPAGPENPLTGKEHRNTRERIQDPANVAATPTAKPTPATVSPSGPSVIAPAVLSPAIKTQTREPENVHPLNPAPVKPDLPVSIRELRLKEEMSMLFFNSSIRQLPTETPDIDYGMLDPEANGGIDRLLKNIRKNLLSGNVEAGIKGGIEAGFQKYSAVKLAISPYVQYSISPRMSILLQPGLKFGRLTNTEIIPKSSYYTITNETVTANHIVNPAADSTLPDNIIRRYYYTETYDSLNIGYNTASKGLFEFELPVLLQYKVNDKLSVYGGVNINFSKTIRLKEDKVVYQGVSQTDSVIYPETTVNTPSPDPPPVDNMFSHSAQPYKQYGSQLWQNPTNDPLKVGYMLGVSYKVKERVRIDVLMQRNASNTSYIINKDIRSIHNQPYFRVTVGYRLFKSK